MKIVRFLDEKELWGILDDRKKIDVLEQSPFNGFKSAGKQIELDNVRLLAPAEPSKIVAVGLNYSEHANELKMSEPDEPIIFLKPQSSIIGTGDMIDFPKSVKQLDYEAELAIVIGREAKNVNETAAKKYIFGYTCANDITARDLQKKDGQWSRAKGFDTFCPLGPWIETDLDVKSIKVECLVNGVVKQSGNTGDMIFGVDFIVSFVSSIMTLNAQDVILTGTPKGVGGLKDKDMVEVYIEGIGTLSNEVRVL